MQILEQVLSLLMNAIYGVVKNYGVAIILFTLVSKIILLPVTLWTYFNSIKMLKIQPDVNFLKVKYYGQSDTLADEQNRLFKEQGYHPLLSTVPLIVQLILLAGVVEVIKAGIANPAIDMSFGPINLGLVPSKVGPSLLWSPIAAGLSSWILCVCQNRSNVLQSEQGKVNKYGTMAFSVCLSLYLGWFVPIGTCLYWICSNLMAVAQMYITNWIVRPRRFVDYEKLEESRKALAAIQSVGKKKRESYFSENKRRERRDYKRFFSVVNKHLVFYSESNGFYKYFKGIIEYLLAHTNMTIHYITSDPNDNIFHLERENPRIRAYYIGENRLITLMMKMDADVVVMTMPDLENYHIKRSYVRKDIEYVYVPHAMDSGNLTTRKGSTDHFDTILCAGPHQVEENQKIEALYGLPKKNVVCFGFPLLDEMRENYLAGKYATHEKPSILIAPSWQPDNIVDSCLDALLDQLGDGRYAVTVRPHPQEVRHKQKLMDNLKKKYSSNPNITIQTDFSSNSTVFESDLLITDWSGIAFEFAFATYKPVLFIDTPMKIMNPDYKLIDTVPLNILLRDKLGRNLKLDELDKTRETVEYLLAHSKEYHDQIDALSHQYIYNHGTSAQVGAEYLIHTIKEKIKAKGAN